MITGYISQALNNEQKIKGLLQLRPTNLVA